ncbi:MAG TPA: hypothetical protein PKH33_16485 [bacterium]|nr:hypothetical protein [bacterium]
MMNIDTVTKQWGREKMKKLGVMAMIVLFAMTLVCARAWGEEPNIVAFGEDLIDISQFSQWDRRLYIDGGEEIVEEDGVVYKIKYDSIVRVSKNLEYLSKLRRYYRSYYADDEDSQELKDVKGKIELYSMDGSKHYELFLDEERYVGKNEYGFNPSHDVLNSGNVLLAIDGGWQQWFEMLDIQGNSIVHFDDSMYIGYVIPPSDEYVVLELPREIDGNTMYEYIILEVNGVRNTIFTHEKLCTTVFSKDSHYIAFVCSGDAVYLFDRYGNAVLTTPTVNTSDGKSNSPDTYYSDENEYLIMVYRYYPVDSIPVPNKEYLKVIRISTNETVYEGLENNSDKELMYKEEEL